LAARRRWTPARSTRRNDRGRPRRARLVGTVPASGRRRHGAIRSAGVSTNARFRSPSGVAARCLSRQGSLRRTRGFLRPAIRFSQSKGCPDRRLSPSARRGRRETPALEQEEETAVRRPHRVLVAGAEVTRPNVHARVVQTPASVPSRIVRASWRPSGDSRGSNRGGRPNGGDRPVRPPSERRGGFTALCAT
jgi:hypothetical protein